LLSNAQGTAPWCCHTLICVEEELGDDNVCAGVNLLLEEEQLLLVRDLAVQVPRRMALGIPRHADVEVAAQHRHRKQHEHVCL
jgi:hypothetical protein